MEIKEILIGPEIVSRRGDLELCRAAYRLLEKLEKQRKISWGSLTAKEKEAAKILARHGIVGIYSDDNHIMFPLFTGLLFGLAGPVGLLYGTLFGGIAGWLSHDHYVYLKKRREEWPAKIYLD